jgi:N-acetylmuramoyl-L-alanine amidase-like protein
MPRYSGASWRPLEKSQGQSRMTRHDIVCLHTMVGSLTSTDSFFRKGGWSGTESHFGVGGKWGADATHGLDGKVYQWQDTNYRADANLEGNHHIISIETADNAPARPDQILAWTPKQLDAIVKIIAWACKEHDIPAVLIPDSKPGRRGIGYHRLGCEHSRGIGAVPGFLVAGGERWSTSRGKECPGSRRIAQIPGIIERVKAELRPKPVTPKEIDMEWTDKIALTETDANVWNAYAKATGNTSSFKAGDKVSVSDMVRYPTLARKIFLEQIKINAKLDKLLGSSTPTP